jgi:hypothetical protein
MADKQKKDIKSKPVTPNQSGECPKKEGDNCIVPGVFNDSDPISGGP